MSEDPVPYVTPSSAETRGAAQVEAEAAMLAESHAYPQQREVNQTVVAQHQRRIAEIVERQHLRELTGQTYLAPLKTQITVPSTAPFTHVVRDGQRVALPAPVPPPETPPETPLRVVHEGKVVGHTGYQSPVDLWQENPELTEWIDERVERGALLTQADTASPYELPKINARLAWLARREVKRRDTGITTLGKDG